MKIFIDAGHGGRDPGAVGNGMRESDITLDVSLRLDAILRGAGVETNMSRREDAAVNIDERWRTANTWGADYFISIHVNAGGGTGAETLYFRPDSEEFARTVQDVYSDEMGLRNRRIWRREDVGVIRWSNCPTVLIELAFIDSPAANPDINILRNKRQEMAVAVASGLFEYLELSANPEIPPVGGRFNTLDQLPAWARPTIEMLVERGFLKGDGEGLDLSADMVRMFVVNDRAGVYQDSGGRVQVSGGVAS